MSVYTFDDNYIDLTYEVTDVDLFNDILVIEGVSGSEYLRRGIDAASILLYGRRSKKINRPLAVNEATAETLITAQLDQFKDPKPVIHLVFVGDSLAKINAIMDIEISDEVTVICTEMGLSDTFWVDSIEMRFGYHEGQDDVLIAEYDLIGQ